MQPVGARKPGLYPKRLFERIKIPARIENQKTKNQQGGEHKNTDSKFADAQFLLSSWHYCYLPLRNLFIYGSSAIRSCSSLPLNIIFPRLNIITSVLIRHS